MYIPDKEVNSEDNEHDVDDERVMRCSIVFTGKMTIVVWYKNIG